MPWIKFDHDFDYSVPGTRTVIAYKEGSICNVPQTHKVEAVALGKAHAIARPRSKTNAGRP